MKTAHIRFEMSRKIFLEYSIARGRAISWIPLHMWGSLMKDVLYHDYRDERKRVLYLNNCSGHKGTPEDIKGLRKSNTEVRFS